MNCEYCDTPRKSPADGTCHKCGAPLRRVYGLISGVPVYADTVKDAEKDYRYLAFGDPVLLTGYKN